MGVSEGRDGGGWVFGDAEASSFPHLDSCANTSENFANLAPHFLQAGPPAAGGGGGLGAEDVAASGGGGGGAETWIAGGAGGGCWVGVKAFAKADGLRALMGEPAGLLFPGFGRIAGAGLP